MFALAAPMRAFCRQSAGKIQSADYILVHHQNARYESVADELDAILGITRTSLRSIRCRMGRYC